MTNKLAIHGGQPAVPAGLVQPWPPTAEHRPGSAQARRKRATSVMENHWLSSKAPALAAVAQAANPRRQRRVVGNHRAAIAERTEILGRVEAPGGHPAEGPGQPAAVAGAAATVTAGGTYIVRVLPASGPVSATYDLRIQLTP